MRPQLTMVDSEEEIMPGVAMPDAAGHTPGHVVVTFCSSGKKLMYVADTVIYPLHLEHPDWTPVFDMLPQKAEASKRRIFDMAARGNWLVMAQHVLAIVLPVAFDFARRGRKCDINNSCL